MSTNLEWYYAGIYSKGEQNSTGLKEMDHVKDHNYGSIQTPFLLKRIYLNIALSTSSMKAGLAQAVKSVHLVFVKVLIRCFWQTN